jgi:ABC-type transport system involved in multi-copper enzyme maturation permease subunit
MRIFAAGLRKLQRRMVTWITFGLLVGLLALILIAVGATAKQQPTQAGRAASLLLLTFPGAYSFVLSFILGLGGLFAVIYGAAVAGSEWTWGTLKNAVARGESRSRYILLTFAAVALFIGIGLVLSYVIGILVTILAANLAGVGTGGLNDSATLGKLPDEMARGWLAVAEAGALGFAIATIARSQLAGIGAGIGVYFGEQFASIFLPDIVRYLPFNAANAVIARPPTTGEGGGGGIANPLSPDVAVVVVTLWLVGALIVAALFTERAEISG